MEPDDLAQAVRRFVAEQLPWLPPDMPGGADLVESARLYGDDVYEFVEAFGGRFDVDVTGFRWEHHTGPEGCNPLWMLFPPWWVRLPNLPIRMIDLVDSARDGMWSIRYPE